MPPAKPKRIFLSIDEISPAVHEASCFQFQESTLQQYRVPSHHLLLVESGKIEARTPDGHFHATGGDLYCFRPADWNEYRNHGPVTFYQAHLEFAPPPRQQFTPVLDGLGPLPVHIKLGTAFPEVRRAFEAFCLEIARDGPVPRLRLRAAVHEMLAVIAGVLSGQRHDQVSLDEWQRLRARMEADLKSNLTIRQLARQMRLSPPYFAKAFRERFGMAPKQFHTLARLREATRLLRSGDRPVKAVAYEVGFRDPKLFARVCKHHLGVLPSDLRLHPTKTIPPDRAGQALFPFNTHMLPPRTPPNWIERYYPPGSGPMD